MRVIFFVSRYILSHRLIFRYFITRTARCLLPLQNWLGQNQYYIRGTESSARVYRNTPVGVGEEEEKGRGKGRKGARKMDDGR